MSPYALNIVVCLFNKSVALFLFSGSNYSYSNCHPPPHVPPQFLFSGSTSALVQLKLQYVLEKGNLFTWERFGVMVVLLGQRCGTCLLGHSSLS